MVYDDDTFDSPHQPIDSSDRWPVDVGEVPPKLVLRIAQMAANHPDWEPTRILDEMRLAGHQVNLDEIRSVLSLRGWSTGR